MKIQVSRDGYRPDRRYSGVYQQQGRMITDADWNEMVAIAAEALRSRVGDMVGSGSPALDGVVDDSGQLRPGAVYADGVRAELRPRSDATGHVYDSQADFPGRPVRPGGAHQLYLDVWERTVVSLADPALLDPALHGADTTSRTQTMAQLKWAPPGVDLLDPDLNPQVGNGTLTAALRHGGTLTESDPCDPCAQEIVTDVAATGNYLFRVEVHDIGRDSAGLSRIVLKWSSENGAEQFEWESRPPSFAATGWAYETYDDVAEKHLGVHLVPGFTPTRGTLGADVPSLAPEDPSWVRRWDGFCRLSRHGSQWQLDTSGPFAGVDRGIPLASQSPLGPSHGNVEVASGASTLEVHLNLLSLKVSLDLSGGRVVPGDFWQVLVRERGERQVTVLSAQPTGVRHHYLPLGQEDATGRLDLDPVGLRALRFPRLTGLMAGDVGFDGGCANGFLEGTTTVDQALNALCELGATHVAYQAPEDCAGGAVGTPATVKEALDALCDLAADHVAYSAPEDCASGVLGTPSTVKDALDSLCGLSAGHVGFQSESDVFTSATNVHEALEALADPGSQELRWHRALYDALAALFGRGVLSGVVPTMTVSSSGSKLLLELHVGAGTVLSGRGMLRRIEADLHYSALLDIPTSGGITVLPGNLLGDRLVALREEAASPLTTGRFGAAERAVLTDDIIAAVTEEMTAREFTGLDDLRDRIADLSGVPTVELADEIVESVVTLDLASFTPVERTLWLYLLLPEDGDPALVLRGHRPPASVDTGPVVRDAVGSPQTTPTVDPSRSCAQVHEQAWAFYDALTVPAKNTDGEVCLGKVGTFGSAAWISPDDREQLVLTPALQNALWRGRLNSVHDEMKAACTRLSSINPAQGRQGEQLTAMIVGNAMAGAAGVTFSGTGLTAQVTSVDEAGRWVQARISIAATAPLGSRSFTVETPAGSISSGSLSFTVLGAVGITGLSPSTLRQGTTTSVTITGAGLSQAHAVSFGAGIKAAVTSAAEQSVTATVVVEANASLEPRAFTVYTPTATHGSGTLRLGVSPWLRATAMSRTSARQFEVPFDATIWGANLQGTSHIAFSGTGVVAQVLSSAPDRVDVRVTVSSSAETTTRTLTVSTPSGVADSTVQFAVLPMSDIWTQRPSGAFGTDDTADRLTYQVRRGVVPTNVVRFTLLLASTSSGWRKEIKGLGQSLVVDGRGDRRSVDVPATSLPASIIFNKAKAFGIPTDVLTKGDVRHLAGGAELFISWDRD